MLPIPERRVLRVLNLLTLTIDEANAMYPAGVPPKFLKCYACSAPAYRIECGRFLDGFVVQNPKAPENQAFVHWLRALCDCEIAVSVCEKHDGNSIEKTRGAE